METASIWPKVLSSIFLGCVLSAKGIWKGDIMVADIEELEEMDVSELHVRRLNVKEVLTSMTDEIFILSIADPIVKISGGDQDLKNIHLNQRQSRQRRRTRQSSKRIRRIFFNPTSRFIVIWWWSPKWFFSISGDFIYCHCASNCTCRLKNLPYFTVIHCRYQNY